jgi:tetratricopeptide (TPR) repeat protein
MPHDRCRLAPVLSVVLGLLAVHAEAQATDWPALRAEALAAVGDADLRRAGELFLRLARIDPTRTAPLAHLRLHLSWMPDRSALLAGLDDLAGMALPAETRRLCDTLRFELARKLGRGKDAVRLADFAGTFRAFQRIAFPRAPFDPFLATELPPAARLDLIDLASPVAPVLRPDAWHSGASAALFFGAFELGADRRAQVLLETDDPARLFLDGRLVLEVDPELGLHAGRSEADLELTAGRHRVLLASARGRGSWEVRLLFQGDDGVALDLVPLAGAAEVRADDFTPWTQPGPDAWPAPVEPAADPLDDLDLAALELERGEFAHAEDRLSGLAARLGDSPRKGATAEIYLALAHRMAASSLGSSERHRAEEASALQRAAAGPDAPALARILAARSLIATGERLRSGALIQADHPGTCLDDLVRAEWLGRFGPEPDRLAALVHAHECGAHLIEAGEPLIEALQKAGRAADAIETARRTLRENADNTNLRFRLVRTLAAAGKAAEAEGLCRAPDAAAGPGSLARCDGTFRLQAGQPELARDAFQAAGVEAPWNAEALTGLSEALDLLGEVEEAARTREAVERLVGTGRGRLPQLWEALDVPLEPLLAGASRRPPPAAPRDLAPPGIAPAQPPSPELLRFLPAVAGGATTLQLIDVSLVDVEDTGRWREAYHGSVQALDAAARNELGELRIPADARLLHARVHLPDGRTLLPEQIQNDGRSQVVSFYGLEDGAVADWAWERAAQPLAEIHTDFVFAAPRAALGVSRFCLAGAEDMPGLAVFLRNEERLRSGDGLVGGRKTRCFERQLVPPVAQEPAMPELTAVEPSVSLRFEPPAPQLALGLLRRLVLAGRRDGRLVRRAREWVAEIGGRPEDLHRFVRSRVAEGEGAESPADAILLGRGTAEQRVGLAKVLCDAAGVPAQLAASVRLPEPATAAGASMRLGPLALVVGEPEADRWLWSFSSAALGPRGLDPSLRDTTLVLLGRGGLAIAQDRPGPGRFDAPSYRVEVAIGPDGSAQVEARLVAPGAAGAAFRERIAQGRPPGELVRAIAASLFPTIELGRSELTGRDPDAEALIVEFSGRVPGLLPAGPLSRFRGLPLPAALGELIAAETRVYPLQLDVSALGERASVRYVLADGLSFGEVPEPFIEIGPFGAYALSVSVEERCLTLLRTGSLPSQQVGPDRFPALRRLLLAIERAEHQSVEVLRSE